MFERSPAALSCDPDLVGRWIPMPGNDPGTMPLGKDDYADVDAHCRVTLSGTSEKTPPQFDARGFRLDGQRYLALGPGDMQALFNDKTPIVDGDGRLPAASVFLLKYRLVEDRIEIALPDMAYAVEHIEDGSLAAREAETMISLLQGDEARLQQVLTGHPDLFESFGPAGHNLRMRRATAQELP